MFRSLDYLKVGNDTQQKAYHSVQDLKLLEMLEDYNPTLTGTIPIELDLPESDLDIIMEAHDLDELEVLLENEFQHMNEFEKEKKKIRGENVLKVNFIYNGFPFELFAQNVPVHRQNAYLHMVIEYRLLQEQPGLRETIKNLKKRGYKTEPAFAQVLGLKGDPYEALLEYGRERGYID